MSERCGRRRPRGGRSERPDIHLSVYLVFSVLEEAHRVCLSELHSAIAGELDENEMVADNRPRRHEVNGRVRQPTSKAVPASPGSGEAAAGEFHALLLGGGGARLAHHGVQASSLIGERNERCCTRAFVATLTLPWRRTLSPSFMGVTPARFW